MKDLRTEIEKAVAQFKKNTEEIWFPPHAEVFDLARASEWVEDRFYFLIQQHMEAVAVKILAEIPAIPEANRSYEGAIIATAYEEAVRIIRAAKNN